MLSHLSPGPDQRRDRRGQRRARLDPDGGDRRRRADALLRQASAPGSEPARRRVAVRDLPAVRQARLARRLAAPVPRDPRKGLRARRERPPRPGAGRRADGHLLQGNRRRAVRSACSPTPRRWPSRRSTTTTAEKIVKQLLAAKTPLLYVGGGILLADAATELREFAEHLQLPVAHTLMGKGALPDDHPLILGMTGFWGTKFINDKCKGADWILGLGTRFSEADCSSWEDEYTFNFPPTKLIHIDIDPAEIGRNYPVAIGAVADLKPALTVLNRVARKLAPAGRQAAEAAWPRWPPTARPSSPATGRRWQSDAWPMRPERILADLRAVLPRDAIIVHRRGLEQERHGPAVPDLHAGQRLHPGRLRDHGLRLAGGAGRQGGAARTRSSWRWSATAASARTRRRWPPRSRSDIAVDLGDHEQPRLRHHRRPRDGALRHDLRHGVREGRQDLLARLRGDRPGLRRRGHQGRLRRRVQAGAGEGDQARSSPVVHRRRT